MLGDLRAGERGTVEIGCVESLASSFLPQVFAAFHRQYPLIRLKARVSHTAELIKLVEQGEVDMGLILDPTISSQLLIVEELFRQPLQLLVPSHHPLTHQATPIPLARIVEEPLLLLEETSRLGQITKRILAQHGLSTRPLVEIESVEGLKEFVRLGVGVALTLPALVRYPQIDKDLVLLPVSEITEEFIFALVYRRIGTLSHVARTFLKTISSYDQTHRPNK